MSNFLKCPRHIKYVLSVAIAGNVESSAPFTMKCIFSSLWTSHCAASPCSFACCKKNNLHVCPATVHHTEALFSIVKGDLGREHDDPMDDLDVNMVIWGKFLNATLRAAGHLGQDHEANLRYVKNHFWNGVGQLFNENEKLSGE